MITPLDASPRLSFAHMGDYHVLIRSLLSILGREIIVPPPITRRTLEQGAMHSPEGACIPFKYNLGNYLEAAEQGANLFLTVGGGCRFRYYFELHRKILHDLGYEVDFIQADQRDLYPTFRNLRPGLSRIAFYRHFMLIMRKLAVMDDIQERIRKQIGFEVTPGAHDAFWADFMSALAAIPGFQALRRFAETSRAEVAAMPCRFPASPLRVGVVGELYMLMEPFANFSVEKILGHLGVQVHRWVHLTTLLHHAAHWQRHQQTMIRQARPYADYTLGAHGIDSVARVHHMIKTGYHGAIHLKPFGCMPEINAMSVIQRMSRDHGFPIICFSFDAHTSEGGVRTRLEAFHDMMTFKQQGAMI